MTIEENDTDKTKSSSENRPTNDSKNDSTLSRLGIPSVVIQRTTSFGSKGSLKNGQKPLRPRSILSVVELSVEDTQENAWVIWFVIDLSTLYLKNNDFT